MPSNIFSKIGIAIFIICVIGLISNIVGSSRTSGTNSYETDYDSEIDTSFVDTTGTDDYTSVDPSNDNSEVSENWVQQYYSNFSFSLPESMTFNYGESSQNQKVYTDEESNIGITLVRSKLPEGQENESIRSLIGYNTREFAEDVSQNLKNHFTDIQLVDYNYGVLGNIEAFIVRNKSTEFSGKYIDMEIKNFFMISSPDYYSITLVYPENSISAKEIVSKIIDSFNDQNVTYSKSYESDDYSSSNRTTNRYMANQDRVYFYSDPGFNIRKNSYLV